MKRTLHTETKHPKIRVQGLGKRNTEVQPGQPFRTRYEIRKYETMVGSLPANVI